MQNPVTGSGGMLIGTVEEVGPRSPLGLRPGDRVATLVSLTLTPLAITDGLAGWDGRSEQVPCDGHAILFARSIAAVLPADLHPELSLAVLDVCGAPALTARVVAEQVRVMPRAAIRVRCGGGDRRGRQERFAVAGRGAAGGCRRTVGVVPVAAERDALVGGRAWPTRVALADARDPVGLSTAVTTALGAPADVTVVCVDVPGCEHGAILATADGGTVIFFCMATSSPPPRRWARRAWRRT